MERSSNVVRLSDAKDRLSGDERETIETILYFFTHREVAYKECEFTTKSMELIRAEQETKEASSHAFIYPVSIWPVNGEAGNRIGHLIVMDLGKRRAFYYHALSAW